MSAVDINYIHSIQQEYLGENKPINKTNPLVSVYVTTYQQIDYISNCLDSILMQKTEFPFEIVLGEDQSTDGTREICKQYAKKHKNKIRLFLRDRKQTAFYDEKGLFYKSINGILTLKSCVGKYVAMCEGDDYWTDPYKLQKQVFFLETNPEYSLCFHPVKVTYEDKSQHDYIFPNSQTHPFLYQNSFTQLKDLIQFNYIQTNSVMYRWRFDNEKLEDIFPFDILPGDWFLHLLHAEKGKIGFIKKVMSVYRRHQGGIWWNSDRDQNKFMQQNGLKHLVFYQALERRWPEEITPRLKDNHTMFAADVVRALYDTKNFDKLNNLKKRFPEYYDRVVEHLVSLCEKLIGSYQTEKTKNTKLINENNKLRMQIEELTQSITHTIASIEKNQNANIHSINTGASQEILVSIIIPLFNKVELTKNCLEALVENTPYELYEVIIIDNASTDGTGSFLESLEGDVKIIHNDTNLGFATACNQGAHTASGKYLVFLNNDTIPHKGWLNALIDSIESSSDIGIVGSKLLYPDSTIQHAGVVVTNEMPAPFHIYTRFPSDFLPANKSRDFQAVTGACMIIRNDFFQNLGGFDERYINGYEDVDLCFRVGEKGKKIRYCPQSVLTHFESMTPGRQDRMDDNARLLYQKWNGKIQPDFEKILKDDGFHPNVNGGWDYRPGSQPFESQKERNDPRPYRSHRIKISIIIPVFNKVDLTQKCLLSLIENTPEDLYEVIIVDNASTDGTKDFLATLKGDVYIIRNDTNLGFACACNQGADVASGEYILFLNNDTTVTKDWLNPILETIQQPGAGLVGCKLLYPDNRIQHAGIAFINGIPDHPYRYERADHPDTCSVKEMDMVTGACFMIHRQLFLDLCGFDEVYKNGVEDIDLCLRVRQAGYKIFYQPETVIYHHEGQSAGRFNHVNENLSIFFKRWQNSFDKNGQFKQPIKERIVPSQKSILIEKKSNIVWEGSQFVNHSLAAVNRELCLRLIKKGYNISIIPYEKDQFTSEQEPRFKPVAERTYKNLGVPADVHVRHQWPPQFSPPAEGHWVMIQPWEFGSLPQDWVFSISAGVDEVWVPSNFVRDCYIQSGVPPERVFVVSNGVDTELFNLKSSPYKKLKTKKKFKFLFVGGTIYRKGIDILLDVYTESFSASDDVCLIIKDMGGQSFYKGQTAKEMITEIKSKPEAPEIEYIEHMLDANELAGLYKVCDCLVHPYRGEGFGLPIAEAMACGCPVIVTGHGAALDFCPEDIAYLIPSKIVNLPEKRIGENKTVDFPWLAESDKEKMALLMKNVVEHPEEAASRGKAGAAFIKENFTWDHAVHTAMARLSRLKHKPVIRFSQTKDSQADITANTSNFSGNAPDEAGNQKLIKEFLQSGEDFFNQGNLKSAVEKFKLALQLSPGDTRALNNLGVIQWQLGDPISAIKTFQNVLEKDPENRDAVENIAHALVVTKRPDLINIEIMEKIIKSQPENLPLKTLINTQFK